MPAARPSPDAEPPRHGAARSGQPGPSGVVRPEAVASRSEDTTRSSPDTNEYGAVGSGEGGPSEAVGRQAAASEEEGKGNAPVTLGVTGASGAPYAVRLLEALNRTGVPVRLIVSETGWRLLRQEAGIEDEATLRERTGDWSGVVAYRNDDRGATPASGSAPSRGMVVCPCSMGTLASIAQGTTRSLIERAADVVLKERRPLVLVPRETPYSIIHLENMLRLARAGVVVLPASPGFYHQPQTIGDLVDFVVARVLAHLGIESTLGPLWRSGEGG